MNYRDTVLNINMDNCFHNLDIIKQLNPNKKIIAVVKANAYGHGLCGFSNILEKYNKVDYFSVATLDEAILLRKNGIKKDILILGVTHSDYFHIAHKYNIIITCHNLKCANDIFKFNEKLKVHIKIDTGMNRLGFKHIDTFKKSLHLIDSSKSELNGIFTQLSSADTDTDYTLLQIKIFKNFYELVKTRNIEIHIQNTAGIVNNSDLNIVTAIRPGLIMYGHNCTNYNLIDDTTNKQLDLKELITLKSKVTMIKPVPPNSKIGYNGDFICKDNTYIATLPIGYADGYKTIYKNLFVMKDLKKYKIRGKICMDQILVEVDNKINEDDYLFLINDEINAKYIAEKTYTSIYELLTSLSNRIHRNFYINNKLIAYENLFNFKILGDI